MPGTIVIDSVFTDPNTFLKNPKDSLTRLKLKEKSLSQDQSNPQNSEERWDLKFQRAQLLLYLGQFDAAKHVLQKIRLSNTLHIKSYELDFLFAVAEYCQENYNASHVKLRKIIIELESYDLILISENSATLNNQNLQSISSRHGNKPLLIKNNNTIKIWGNTNGRVWGATQLEAPAFQHLVFSNNLESSVNLSASKVEKEIYKEIAQKSGHNHVVTLDDNQLYILASCYWYDALGAIYLGGISNDIHANVLKIFEIIFKKITLEVALEQPRWKELILNVFSTAEIYYVVTELKASLARPQESTLIGSQNSSSSFHYISATMIADIKDSVESVRDQIRQNPLENCHFNDALFFFAATSCAFNFCKNDGTLYEEAGRIEIRRIINDFELAIDLLKPHVFAEHPLILKAHSRASMAYKSLLKHLPRASNIYLADIKNYRKKEMTHAEEALVMAVKFYGDYSFHAAMEYHNVAKIYHTRDKLEIAILHQRQAIFAVEQLLPQDSIAFCIFPIYFALYQFEMGDRNLILSATKILEEVIFNMQSHFFILNKRAFELNLAKLILCHCYKKQGNKNSANHLLDQVLSQIDTFSTEQVDLRKTIEMDAHLQRLRLKLGGEIKIEESKTYLEGEIRAAKNSRQAQYYFIQARNLQEEARDFVKENKLIKAIVKYKKIDELYEQAKQFDEKESFRYKQGKAALERGRILKSFQEIEVNEQNICQAIEQMLGKIKLKENETSTQAMKRMLLEAIPPTITQAIEAIMSFMPQETSQHDMKRALARGLIAAITQVASLGITFAPVPEETPLQAMKRVLVQTIQQAIEEATYCFAQAPHLSRAIASQKILQASQMIRRQQPKLGYHELGLTPPYEYAELCRLAYEMSKIVSRTLPENFSFLRTRGWEIYTSSHRAHVEKIFDNFFAISCINRNRQELVISFKGTQLLSSDVLTDVNLSRSVFDVGFAQAIAFCNLIFTDLLKDRQVAVDQYRVRLVGHSLGGALAFVALYYLWYGEGETNFYGSNKERFQYNTHAIGFDAAGVRDLIEHVNKKPILQEQLEFLKSRILNYVLQPNIPNAAMGQFGTLLQISNSTGVRTRTLGRKMQRDFTKVLSLLYKIPLIGYVIGFIVSASRFYFEHPIDAIRDCFEEASGFLNPKHSALLVKSWPHGINKLIVHIRTHRINRATALIDQDFKTQVNEIMRSVMKDYSVAPIKMETTRQLSPSMLPAGSWIELRKLLTDHAHHALTADVIARLRRNGLTEMNIFIIQSCATDGKKIISAMILGPDLESLLRGCWRALLCNETPTSLRTRSISGEQTSRTQMMGGSLLCYPSNAQPHLHGSAAVLPSPLLSSAPALQLQQQVSILAQNNPSNDSNNQQSANVRETIASTAPEAGAASSGVLSIASLFSFCGFSRTAQAQVLPINSTPTNNTVSDQSNSLTTLRHVQSLNL